MEDLHWFDATISLPKRFMHCAEEDQNEDESKFGLSVCSTTTQRNNWIHRPDPNSLNDTRSFSRVLLYSLLSS
jgi:hypothetical protein